MYFNPLIPRTDYLRNLIFCEVIVDAPQSIELSALQNTFYLTELRYLLYIYCVGQVENDF